MDTIPKEVGQFVVKEVKDKDAGDPSVVNKGTKIAQEVNTVCDDKVKEYGVEQITTLKETGPFIVNAVSENDTNDPYVINIKTTIAEEVAIVFNDKVKDYRVQQMTTKKEIGPFDVKEVKEKVANNPFVVNNKTTPTRVVGISCNDEVKAHGHGTLIGVGQTTIGKKVELMQIEEVKRSYFKDLNVIEDRIKITPDAGEVGIEQKVEKNYPYIPRKMNATTEEFNADKIIEEDTSLVKITNNQYEAGYAAKIKGNKINNHNEIVEVKAKEKREMEDEENSEIGTPMAKSLSLFLSMTEAPLNSRLSEKYWERQPKASTIEEVDEIEVMLLGWDRISATYIEPNINGESTQFLSYDDFSILNL